MRFPLEVLMGKLFTQSREAPGGEGAQIVRTPSGDQEMTVISEGGLYRLMMKSRRKPPSVGLIRGRVWIPASQPGGLGLAA